MTTPYEIRRAIDHLRGRIVGIKKSCARRYGRGVGSDPWPRPIVDKLNELRDEAKRYQKMLRNEESRGA